MALDVLQCVGVYPVLRQAVYMCLINWMAGRGRCWRTIGLSSSGPAVLNFWKDEKA